MSNIRIDKDKTIRKWSKLLEGMGVAQDRIEWVSEMAEYQSINENAFNTIATQGMGSIYAPQPSVFAGDVAGSQAGSGDVAQNLLPVSMKIAAQTIGLDLVAVKPSAGPRVELVYVDFVYDDVNVATGRPQVFKLKSASNLTTIKTALATAVTSAGGRLTHGGVIGARVFVANIASSTALVTNVNEDSFASKKGVLEFLGFGRIDDAPIFKAYRQANSQNVGGAGAPNYPFAFDETLNTFGATGSMVSQLAYVGTTAVSGAELELVSALEDHLPGFTSNFNGKDSTGDFPMNRKQDDDSYPGQIGTKIETKSVQIGTDEVSSALRRTDLEDIKSATGMDILQKMEGVLVNEISQKISKAIVAKINSLADLNRSTAPLANGVTSLGVTASTIFDLNTNYVSAVGGETTHAVQRKLVSKILLASNYITTEGRVGPAQYIVTNGALASSLVDISGYAVNPFKNTINGQQIYEVGTIGATGIKVYVDPNQRYDDNSIIVGRKNTPDQPGVVFIPYLMAQKIELMSENTWTPRILLRSRYAIADIGYFPQKQFMKIVVTDERQLLN